MASTVYGLNCKAQETHYSTIALSIDKLHHTKSDLPNISGKIYILDGCSFQTTQLVYHDNQSSWEFHWYARNGTDVDNSVRLSSKKLSATNGTIYTFDSTSGQTWDSFDTLVLYSLTNNTEIAKSTVWFSKLYRDLHPGMTFPLPGGVVAGGTSSTTQTSTTTSTTSSTTSSIATPIIDKTSNSFSMKRNHGGLLHLVYIELLFFELLLNYLYS